MNIYIDESGVFSNPANKDNIASCVGALAIPSSQRRDIIKGFRRLISSWKLGIPEIKGTKLGEDQIADVIRLLKRYEVIFDLVVMDLGLLTQAEITDHKIKSADGMTKNLPPHFHPDVIAQYTGLRQAFLDMSNPLFVQAVMLNILVPHLVQNMLTYYALRLPKEIGGFHWVVDAKDKKITNYEKAWSSGIFPYIYTQSLERPLFFVEEGDYTHFEKNMDLDKALTRLARNNPDIDPKEFGTLSVKKILGGGFEFKDSKSNYGLQLVDILVNAAQRALNGKLKINGWGELGALMIAENPQPVQLITLTVEGKEADPVPIDNDHRKVLIQLKRSAKPLVPIGKPGL
jgi:Protein of unknown function (DUF3800)